MAKKRLNFEELTNSNSNGGYLNLKLKDCPEPVFRDLSEMVKETIDGYKKIHPFGYDDGEQYAYEYCEGPGRKNKIGWVFGERDPSFYNRDNFVEVEIRLELPRKNIEHFLGKVKENYALIKSEKRMNDNHS